MEAQHRVYVKIVLKILRTIDEIVLSFYFTVAWEMCTHGERCRGDNSLIRSVRLNKVCFKVAITGLYHMLKNYM